ncbi:hypothetical protein D3Z62_17115 [Lachnospiraceae bacterium]|nr:hypothetical protein [Lachnospiraceae bacterium]
MNNSFLKPYEGETGYEEAAADGFSRILKRKRGYREMADFPTVPSLRSTVFLSGILCLGTVKEWICTSDLCKSFYA